MFKYYKSDLTLHLHIGVERQTSTGEVVPITTETPFNLRFYVDKKGTPETGFLSSYDGNRTRNCSIISPTDIMAFIDQSQLPFPTGDLLVEVEFIVDDNHFEGDDENNIKRLYRTGITLTDRPDLDSEGEVTIEIFNEEIAPEIIAKAEKLAKETATVVAKQTAEQFMTSYIATAEDIDNLWAE